MSKDLVQPTDVPAEKLCDHPVAEKEHITRRAPHMEKYVKVCEAGEEWRVIVEIGNQGFHVGERWETLQEAEWFRDMVCIAFDNLASAVRLAVIEECAKVADYWGAGHWKVKSERARFSLGDMQTQTNTTGRGIAEDIRALKAPPPDETVIAPDVPTKDRG
jgi:hypothetical protein